MKEKNIGGIHMLKEFKEFAFKGNVVDMAVGVIIGGAFGKIVSSLVSDIIMPFFGFLTKGVQFTSLKVTLGSAEDAAAIMYGNFIQNVVDFFIIAISVFAMITVANKLMNKHKEEAPAPEAPAAPTEAELLTEIRDLLKEKKN